MWVQSLVGELRSLKVRGMAKKYICIIYILKVYILFDPGLGISLLGIDPEDIDAKPFIQVFSL